MFSVRNSLSRNHHACQIKMPYKTVFGESFMLRCNHGHFAYAWGAENDGHENDGPSKCPGMKLADMKLTHMKMTDMKMQDMFQVSE